MSRNQTFDLFATGMAIFAMFFGAGNIIFPLALGQQTVDYTHYAIAGLLLTAVLVPFSGLLAMFLYGGEIRNFFGRLGNKPGLCLAFFIIALLGPLGSTPRCIALSFSTFQLSFPSTIPLIFNISACVCLFLLSYKKQYLLNILGYLLTPLLLGLLGFIMVKGLLFYPENSIELSTTHLESFWIGLKEGYNTMDLLAAFFFAPIIIHLVQSKTREAQDEKSRFYFILKASAIGAFLLAIIYIGFCYLASFHAFDLKGTQPEHLLAMIAINTLGSQAGFIVCMTVILACLTTAVALITAFSGFVHKEILKEKFSYPAILAVSCLMTFFVASMEFQGISQFLTPVLEICYPFLILLTGYNLWKNLKGNQMVEAAAENI